MGEVDKKHNSAEKSLIYQRSSGQDLGKNAIGCWPMVPRSALAVRSRRPTRSELDTTQKFSSWQLKEQIWHILYVLQVRKAKKPKKPPIEISP
jgi:hypothetical protein